MSANSSIEWTDRTWNPVRGCSVISPGCVNCYAMKQAHRFSGAGKPYAGLTKQTKAGPQWTGKVVPVESSLLEPLSWRKPARVFVNSMSDLFHEDVPEEFIDQVFAVMALTQWHTYQILTKRADRMREYMKALDVASRVARAADRMAVEHEMATLKEETLPVPGYDGYYVSNLGTVFSTRRGEMRPMSPDEGEQGHQRVQLYRGHKVSDRVLVHRIVLLTFVGLPPTEDAQGCHRDGNPRNNALPNLRWGTQSDNWADRIRHGNQQSYRKLTLQDVENIKGFRKAGLSKEATAAKFGISATQVRNIERGLQWAESSEWPLVNCWLGVSVENQKFADERIPLLLQTPAAVRFISAEPLLGPLELEHVFAGVLCPQRPDHQVDVLRGGTWAMRSGFVPAGQPEFVNHSDMNRLDWVIVGGESGPGARPMDLAWARSIVQQCKAAGVPVFVKQLGARPFERRDTAPDPDRDPGGWTKITTPTEGPFWQRSGVRDKKGGNPDEWPADLRVREFPNQAVA